MSSHSNVVSMVGRRKAGVSPVVSVPAPKKDFSKQADRMFKGIDDDWLFDLVEVLADATGLSANFLWRLGVYKQLGLTSRKDAFAFKIELYDTCYGFSYISRYDNTFRFGAESSPGAGYTNFGPEATRPLDLVITRDLLDALALASVLPDRRVVASYYSPDKLRHLFGQSAILILPNDKRGWEDLFCLMGHSDCDFNFARWEHRQEKRPLDFIKNGRTVDLIDMVVDATPKDGDFAAEVWNRIQRV